MIPQATTKPISTSDLPTPDQFLDSIPTAPTEYLVVSDKNSKVILSTTDYKETVRMANMIRAAGGEVTVFKSLKS
jgi:hypothetical protein